MSCRRQLAGRWLLDLSSSADCSNAAALLSLFVAFVQVMWIGKGAMDYVVYHTLPHQQVHKLVDMCLYVV